MLTAVLNYAILVAFVLGSVGFLGNEISAARRGREVRWLRYLRNGAIFVIWPLLVVRLAVG